VLTVSDNGDGMDEATRARIFEPFFTTKEPGHGTGLGLAVVHGIVRQSGGNIWVYSEVGRGTTFKIYLPAAPGAVAAENGSSPVEAVPAGARPGTTVLVVDDHRAVRMLTVAVLEAAGYEVFEAASSEEAAAILGRHTVDAVISDVVMPGGTAEAPSYPDDARGHTPPVVYMSGYTADVAVRSKLVGTDARFLEKPFAPAALLSATASAVNA
jgi:CheY-like chemotaxis protein